VSVAPEALRLAGQASARFLEARWALAAGEAVKAGKLYRSAADLWKLAALEVESISPTEALRQRFNRLVALVDSGDIPGASAELPEVQQAIPRLLPDAVSQDRMAQELKEILQGLEGRRAEWTRDWNALSKDLRGVSEEIADHWIRAYPGLPHSHWIASRVAERAGRLEDAREHVRNALDLDRTNTAFLATYIKSLSATLPSNLAYPKMLEIYNEFGSRSARICLMFALGMLELAHKGSIPRLNALETAAASVDRAVHMDPNDLSAITWGFSRVFHQYCLWQLGRPGATAPWGVFRVQRGAEIVEITLVPTRSDPGQTPTEEDDAAILLGAPALS